MHPDRIDVLKNQSIRFSPPIAFNDPVEFKPIMSGVASNDFFQKYMDKHLDELIEDQLTEIPDEIKNTMPQLQLREYLRSCVRSNETLFNHLLEGARENVSIKLFEKSNEFIGVLSLTQKPDNLLMWSHYADSHRGYCLGFDSNHPFFNRKRSENDEFYHLRKVKYLETRPSKLMVDMDGTDMFLLKSDVWDYEKEWRMCAALTDANTIISSVTPQIHLFDFPADAISDIIIGVNADASLIDQILSLRARNSELKHVTIQQASVSESQFSLDFNDL